MSHFFQKVLVEFIKNFGIDEINAKDIAQAMITLDAFEKGGNQL